MVKITLFTVLGALTAGGLATDVTTDMYIIGFSAQALVASVIASDSTATTFSVACATAANCDLPTSFTFTQGPSTVHYDYTHTPTASSDPAGTVTVGCSITASEHGQCSKTISAKLGTITSTAVSATTTFTDASSALGAQIVTVTAGKLDVSTTSSSTTSSSSTSSSTSSASSTTSVKSTITTAPQVSSTVTTSATSTSLNESSDSAFFAATATASIATSSSKAGAMPMVTAHAHWVIGGAAAALALAAL